MNETSMNGTPMNDKSAAADIPAKELPATLARLVGTLDGCLDGVPAEEARQEREWRVRAKALDVEIRRLLAAAGTSRETVGADTLPALRREEERVEAERDGLDAESRETADRLAAVQAELAKLDAATDVGRRKSADLTDRIAFLEREIRDRWILTDVICWVFGDGQKAELASANARRDDVQREIQNLLAGADDAKQRLDALAAAADGLARRRADLDARIRGSQGRQLALRRAIDAAKKHEAIRGRLAALQEAQKVRADARKRDWNEAARSLRACGEAFRRRQPKLAGLGPDGYGKAEAFPDVFAFGDYRFELDGRTLSLPRLLPFPVPRALRVPATDKGTAFVREFLLRALQCLPPESLEITVCDPVRMGASLNGFQGLYENRKPFPERKALTVAKDIEDALARLHGEIDAFLQRDCTGEIRDWASYNASHPGRPRAYRLLVLFDLPEQLTAAAESYLARIVENGPACGILPILACDPASLDPRRFGALRTALEAHTDDAGRLARTFGGFGRFRNARIADETPAALPDAAATADALSGVRAGYTERDRCAGALESLWEGEPLWEASSADGLEAPIGWREDDRATPVLFSIGNHGKPVHHALLGGKSGSGKSNLVHVLLHGLCHRYSPRELNLYLLDYKESIEFNGYADPLLPHAAGIATESDVEYGLSVLRHLVGEMSRRADAFKDAGVGNLFEYRTKTGRPMPRILLVVDEFQRLFETAKDGEAAEEMLSTLLRQSRSHGIHLLLATQTLSGLRNLASTRGLLSQISCRLALACIPEDSATLLQSDNLEAAGLDSPPQGIYNDNLGARSANIRFVIPEAVAETRRLHLSALCAAAAERGERTPDCRVFDGRELPPRPDASDSTVRSAGLRPAVGRTADFEELPVRADLAGKNLLVVGRHAGIDGAKQSVAEGLGAAPGRKAFLVYSENPGDWASLEGPENEIVRVDDEWDCGNLDEFAAGAAPRKFIVLDGFENLRALRSNGYVSSRNGPSAAERLRALVERPAKSGVQLVLCFRDYGRALAVAKDLVSLCDVRIGDASVSDPAKFVSFETAGSREMVLPKGPKAVLADRDADGPVLFRPFAPRG